MSAAADRLFTQQVSRATDASGTVDMHRLAALVVGCYDGAERQARRAEQAANATAAALAEANAASTQSLASLQTQNARFTVAFDAMSNGLSLFGSDGRLLMCNRRQYEILRLRANEVEPGCSFEFMLRASPLVSDRVARACLALAAAARPGETEQTLLGGRDIRLALRPIADGGFLVGVEDVTERSRDAARIAYLANHDILTDLPNRVLLRDRLDSALRAGPCALLCLDLDGFKSVNDTFGQAQGDLLLRAVASRLRGHVRECETLARFGGDAFAVVIAGGLEAATTVAGRMIQAVAAEFDIEHQRICASTSVGIAVAPAAGQTGEALLRHADLALACAKSEGRGCFRVFEPGMGIAAQARRTLQQDLRAALAQGEFQLHYQPQIRLVDGKVISFEALLRWHHPQRGMISPAEFIPAAEESGLIVELGAWVIREACFEAARWPGRIGLAVNVSGVQVHRRDLYHTIANVLQATGLAPERLEIEVTETAMLTDFGAALHVMHRLRAIGVRIAMDDFGHGYSSLNYLQSFPFDRIKIDRSFVGVLGDDQKALAIVRAVTGLANSLGVAVTAEGVETHSQRDTLSAESCGDAQGFLYSRAVPAADIPVLLQRFGFVGVQDGLPRATGAAIGECTERDLVLSD